MGQPRLKQSWSYIGRFMNQNLTAEVLDKYTPIKTVYLRFQWKQIIGRLKTLSKGRFTESVNGLIESLKGLPVLM